MLHATAPHQAARVVEQDDTLSEWMPGQARHGDEASRHSCACPRRHLAHAGIQSDAASLWIPAFAGMVMGGITIDYYCII